MALTVNSNPENIDNSGAFNVTTSLSEDASHVNLRVRCAITVSAVVVATVEKPKGLSDFDLGNILTPHVEGISFARDSGDMYKVAGGSPLVAYTVLFTEVYEDSDGVTQTADTDNASGTTYRYVPCVGEGDFQDYVLSGNTCKFASLTLRNDICRFFTNNPNELWLVFFTEETSTKLYYSKDGGAYSNTAMATASMWGVVVINSGELMSGVSTSLRVYITDAADSAISEVLTIYPDTSQIDERVVLEFDGRVGGKEYLSFEGVEDIRYKTERSYTLGENKNRKPLSYYGMGSQLLETRFKDIGNTEYLKDLLISKDVKRLEDSYATPTDVTVLTDSVKIANSEMFTNEIEIEYED